MLVHLETTLTYSTPILCTQNHRPLGVSSKKEKKKTINKKRNHEWIYLKCLGLPCISLGTGPHWKGGWAFSWHAYKDLIVQKGVPESTVVLLCACPLSSDFFLPFAPEDASLKIG